ncbi:endonuclease/exonuclease/phosphatase family protein [Sphingobacterium thermophilum]|uniref:Endonuclease/exonuclease/phosphatase family protein n=1 Tax=Sphingobacterium thermophilum TaxID=768534 RepID=A0ABP8R831_9SPHI
MRIITWNCNMAFRNKSEYIISKKPDILVIQECENLNKNLFQNCLQKPCRSFWYGTNINKGIGIFTFSNYEIELLKIHNPEFRFILPLSVKNEESEYIILAVWTQKPKYHDCYTEQIWNAIHYYSELFKNENLIIIGDFNSNSIWDKPKRIYNHTNLVNKLLEYNIYSSYHAFYQENQGKETRATLFMHRKKERPYHIDYCFISEKLKNKLKNVIVGEYEFWTKLSDHTPLIVDFKE